MLVSQHFHQNILILNFSRYEKKKGDVVGEVYIEITLTDRSSLENEVYEKLLAEYDTNGDGELDRLHTIIIIV